MLEEQWLPVVGYPHYEVSNYGRIEHTNSGTEIEPWTDEKGHLRVTLVNDKRREDVRLARAVARSFFLNYRKGCFVGYQNGDKSDCTVLNLTLDRDKAYPRNAGNTE